MALRASSGAPPSFLSPRVLNPFSSISLLKRHLECTANYNKEMEENGLKTLGERKVGGAPEDALNADIDSMIDTQEFLPQNNDRNIESLRTDLKREVTDTVKKPEDKAVYGNWMQNTATPALRGTSKLLGRILGLFKDSAIKIVVQVISTAVMGFIGGGPVGAAAAPVATVVGGVFLPVVQSFISNRAGAVPGFFKSLFGN